MSSSYRLITTKQQNLSPDELMKLYGNIELKPEKSDKPPSTFDEFVALAKEKLALDMNQLALKYFYKALELKPEDPPILLLVAETLAKMGNHTEALLILNKVSASHSTYLSNAAFNFQKAKVHECSGNHREALTHYNLALSQPGGSACDDIYLHLGYVYSKLSEHKLAIENFDHAVRRNPSSPMEPEYLLQCGITFFWLKRYQEAIKSFDAAMAKDPSLEKRSTVLYWKGYAYSNLFDVNKMQSCLQKYIETSSAVDFKYQSCRDLAIEYHNSSDYSNAGKYYARAFLVNPRFTNDESILARFSNFSLRIGQTETALAAAEKCLLINPNSASVLRDYYIAAAELNRYEASLALLNKLEKLAPGNFYIMYYQALTLYHLDFFDEAKEAFTKCLEIKDVTTPKPKLSIISDIDVYKADAEYAISLRRQLAYGVDFKSVLNALRPQSAGTDTVAIDAKSEETTARKITR